MFTDKFTGFPQKDCSANGGKDKGSRKSEFPATSLYPRYSIGQKTWFSSGFGEKPSMVSGAGEAEVRSPAQNLLLTIIVKRCFLQYEIHITSLA